MVLSYNHLPCCLWSALFLCVCKHAHTHVLAGPDFIRTVVAPHSPWLVKTQTDDITALCQNSITCGPQRFLTPSCSTCVTSMHKLTHLAHRTNTQIGQCKYQDTQHTHTHHKNKQINKHTQVKVAVYATITFIHLSLWCPQHCILQKDYFFL